METLARHISEACTLREEEKWLASAGERAEVLLGGFWKSAEADWKVIEALRDWTGRFRKLALAAAGGSPDKADAFRKQWARLVADGDDALKPNGVLGKTIAGFLSAYVEFTRAQAGLESGLAGGSTLWGAEPKRVTLAEIRKRLESWKANRSGLRAWCNWRLVRRAATEAGLGLLIATYEGEGLAAAELRKRFDRSFYEAWIDWITEHDTTLQRFFSPEHERKIQLFRDADDQYVRLTRAEIQTRLAARRPRAAERVNEASEMGILQRQRQLRRGHMPVRQLFQKIPHLLPRIKPCILMSPISVAQYLDASHPPFDLVVFDEASQIPTWDAVGAIARGQEVVIVGDPKQLPPTSFFTRADDQEANDEDLVEDMESILDECLSARLPQMLLNWHYRSRHESLIAFSNYHYYENRLLTFPSPFVGRGVSYRHVPTGVYDKGQSRTNRGEAEAVVAEVLRRLCHPVQSRQTIGIVTFSVAQQGLVEDLLDEARQRSPEIEPFFASDAPEPVFVKNLENVQGDERDVILFSVCYGPDAEGRVSVNFGPLNRDGGERRLNVAITRARSEVIVFATLKAEQIDLGRSRARGVQDLKCFLDYADRGPVAIAQALILRGGDDFESPFEKDVCQRLRACGYEVHSQVGCSGYRIDLAIVDPEAPGRYVIGIECDGANYHSAKTARDRDRLREGVLVGLGWRLHRVWSSDWWANPDECMAKLDAAIEQAKLARTVASPAEAAPPAADQGTPETEEIVIADEPPEKPESDASPVYRAYRVKRLLGAQQDFYAPTADSRIRQLIREIVLDEGPVALDLAARRVAAHWGLGRLGSNIRDRIERIARAVDMKWVQHEDRMFLWPPNLDPATYSTFRAPGVGEEEQRDIDEIPPEEIGAAAVHVLKEQVSLPMEQLTRETALVLGFQRAGQTIQRIVGSALELAEKRGTICRDDRGNARLPD
jgi:very-short-patch-repair endonuclease